MQAVAGRRGSHRVLPTKREHRRVLRRHMRCTRPEPEAAMPNTTTIDPGHGGKTGAGGSSPVGVRGPRGTLEKDVTLAICGRVAAHLGSGARLTRSSDVNVSLAQRAAVGRRLGSRAFVSVHANNGGGGTRGTEVWVHTRASAKSAALARHILHEVARYGAPGAARIRRGDLALLEPSLHLPDAGVVLIEVDYLDNPEAERRLVNPRHVDDVGQAIARGVARFLDGGPPPPPSAPVSRRSSALRRAPERRVARPLDIDLTGFDASQFSIIPDDAATRVPNNLKAAELVVLKEAWGRMNGGTGLSLAGSDVDKTSFRATLLDCMATSSVLRDAFLAITASDGHTVTLEVGRDQADVLVDAFEYQASTNTTGRGLHTMDLADIDKVPRVSTTDHLNICTRTHLLIHALVEAAHGVRSAIANGHLRYLASHVTAIDEENRYRTEQGMQGVKGHDQPQGAPGGFELHFRDAATANDVEVDLFHLSGTTITSIDHTP
jgi:N-acetylmuramoyl-L-alanine amidase